MRCESDRTVFIMIMNDDGGVVAVLLVVAAAAAVVVVMDVLYAGRLADKLCMFYLHSSKSRDDRREARSFAHGAPRYASFDS